MSAAESMIRDRIGGAMLMTGAAGAVLAMAHHPTGAHSGGMGGFVHGAMIVLLAAMTFGFVRFTQARGLGRPLLLAGAIAFAASFFAHVGAATINGFIVPALASRGQPVSHDIFLLAWESNQALARLGVFATGLAYVAWGLDLLHERSGRLLGLAALAAGLIPAGLLAAGVIRMDVTGAFLVYAFHAGWAALLGFAMVRGRVRAAV